MMTFLTPGNLIFSSQIPNSTFHSRSQVKIGFLLLKFRLFTPRNLIFPAFYSKKSRSQVKIGFFFFSEPKFRFSTPRSMFFCSSQNPNSTFHSRSQVKIGFPLLRFRLFTPRNLKLDQEKKISSSESQNSTKKKKKQVRIPKST